MADQDGDNLGDTRVPGELFRQTTPRATSPAAVDLAEALGGLDRATKNFTRRLGEGQREVEQARLEGERAIRDVGALRPEGEVEAEPETSAPEEAPAESSFESRMRVAEQEAQIYLESAKRRADSLVQAMVGAVEHEAAEARREAEESIRARWHQVEVESTRHVENARRVSTQMVAERQNRISKLSDGISDRAEALTLGMDDAGKVKAQFDAFVRALSVTADQIARDPAGKAGVGEVRDIRETPRPSAMAA
jgi:hypothetical protein